MMYRMKKLATLIIALLFIFVFSYSCKNDENPIPEVPLKRKVKFELFTTKDFSTYEGTITFKALINGSDRGRRVWDSTFAPMRVKDIPNEANKIAFEKVIDRGELPKAIGFEYYLEGVGLAWYVEQVSELEYVKTVKLDFK